MWRRAGVVGGAGPGVGGGRKEQLTFSAWEQSALDLGRSRGDI